MSSGLFTTPGGYAFRTPLLPFHTLLNLSGNALKEWYSHPLMQEAIFIAAPGVSAILSGWLQGQRMDAKQREKLEITLAKYLLRMAYRCTPYGLFAGISTGTFSDQSDVRLASQSQYRRHSRMDMDYLCAMASSLSQQPEIQAALSYYPNNSIYRVGNTLRYIEYRLEHKMRTHHLVSIDDSLYVRMVLEGAKNGATLNHLADSLVDADISQADARAFIRALIESQVLVSNLEALITGKDYLDQLTESLAAAQKETPIRATLENVRELLQQTNGELKTPAIALYSRISTQLEALAVPFEPGQLFQVDMFKPVLKSQLHSRVVAELTPALELLAKTQGPPEENPLDIFMQAFAERYEAQEVPLLEVLDSEMGIGYPVSPTTGYDDTPLLDEVLFPEEQTAKTSLIWSDWQDYILAKYNQAIQRQQPVIQLEEAEVQAFLSKPMPPLATSMYTLGSVLAESGEAVDRGEFQIVHQFTVGPSAASLVGRFCHLDAELHASVRQALQQEEVADSDAIFAEIVHINQARIGNISIRPRLRAYEIPIVIQAGVDESHTLLLEDLLISVRYNQLLLRSKKLNRRIIPRLSTAHNYVLGALAPYRFLCDLQFQHVQRGLSWDWGALKNAAFLPRVCYGKVILSPAQWKLSSAEVQAIQQATGDELPTTMHTLRQQRQIPQWITVGEADQVLPINLADSMCIAVLKSLLKGKDHLTIRECLFNPDNLLVNGPEGGFTNEFIFPWHYQSPAQSPEKNKQDRHVPVVVPAAFRYFEPGSEWLYVKLYCGVKSADRLLTELIQPLTEQLLREELITEWFFIRYEDPDHHLRVRFRGAGEFYGQVITRLYGLLRPYFAARLVLTCQIDTYQREIERYGPENIEDSERLFFFDSQATVAILSLLEGDAGDAFRWQLALRGADAMLADFGLTLPEKKQLLGQISEAFKQEFTFTAGERKSLAEKFRKQRKTIEAVLALEYGEDDALAPAFRVFEQRSECWKSTVQAIREKELSVAIYDLLATYLHMFFNRFFRSSQRMQELVAYDMLHQYYIIQLAKAKKADVLNPATA